MHIHHHNGAAVLTNRVKGRKLGLYLLISVTCIFTSSPGCYSLFCAQLDREIT